jgi:dehydrogenase/reductase SDR family member 12
MIQIENKIHLDLPPSLVFPVLSDYSRIKEWNPFINKAKKTSQGKVGLNTKYTILKSFFNNSILINYTITAFQPNHYLEIKGTTENIDIVHKIDFFDEGKGSELIYYSEYDFKGVLKPWEGLLYVFLKNQQFEIIESIKTVFSSNPIPQKNYLNKLLYPFLLPMIHDFTKYGYRNSRKRWKVILNSGIGKTVLITGGSTGVGLEISILYARAGAKVIVVEKKPENLYSSVDHIKKLTGNPNIFPILADLSLMSENSRVAELIKQNFADLSIIVNNLGNIYHNQIITQEGFEKSASLMLMGPYVLVESLYPILVHHKDSRVINVSSGGMYSQRFTLRDLFNSTDYNGMILFAKYKRAMVILSDYWAMKWKRSGVKSFSMHPGWTDTESIRNSLPVFYRFMKTFLRSPDEGADCAFWLGISEDLEEMTGGFWFDRELQTQHIFLNTSNSDEEINECIEYLENICSPYINRKMF